MLWTCSPAQRQEAPEEMPCGTNMVWGSNVSWTPGRRSCEVSIYYFAFLRPLGGSSPQGCGLPSLCLLFQHCILASGVAFEQELDAAFPRALEHLPETAPISLPETYQS